MDSKKSERKGMAAQRKSVLNLCGSHVWKAGVQYEGMLYCLGWPIEIRWVKQYQLLSCIRLLLRNNILSKMWNIKSWFRFLFSVLLEKLWKNQDGWAQWVCRDRRVRSNCLCNLCKKWQECNTNQTHFVPHRTILWVLHVCHKSHVGFFYITAISFPKHSIRFSLMVVFSTV